ncbi:MAG: pitrilysin family protein [Caulobacteraceae bacterium]
MEGRGQVLGQAIELEGDAHRADADIAALQAVSAADVQRVARQYLTDDRRMVILYHAGPEPIPVGGRSPPVAAAPTPPVAEVAAPAAAPAPPAERQPPPPPGPPVQAALPAPAERTLPNGLKVIVARSTDIPLVTAVLNIGAGGADDPKALAGLADMTASLLSRGAAGRTAEEVAQAVEGLGGALQAGATWDGSQVGVTVLADKLGAALPILADIARRPTLSPQELEIQRRQSLDDLTVELQEPGAIARYAAQVAVFAGGPYGHVLGGTPASLGRITAADVRAFHDAWYRPDDAVLVLAGDIDPERGFALAEQAFGDWTAPAAPPPAAPTAPPASAAAPRVIVVDLPGAGQASVTVAEPAIRRADPRYYQAVVANTVLGGGYSARLNAEIRIKRGLSYGADSSLDARREPGMVVASAQTRNEAAPQVVELMLDQLRQMGVAPAGADELEARKTSLAGEYGRNLETTEGLARTLSAYAVLDIAPSEIGRYGPSVQAVTAGQAEAEAAALFDPARADIVVAGDAKAFIPALKAKYPNLELIPAAELDLDSPSLRKPAG